MVFKNKQNFIIRPNISIVSYATAALHREGYKLIASCHENDVRCFKYIQNKQKSGFEIKILRENSKLKQSGRLHIWARHDTTKSKTSNL